MEIKAYNAVCILSEAFQSIVRNLTCLICYQLPRILSKLKLSWLITISNDKFVNRIIDSRERELPRYTVIFTHTLATQPLPCKLQNIFTVRAPFRATTLTGKWCPLPSFFAKANQS